MKEYTDMKCAQCNSENIEYWIEIKSLYANTLSPILFGGCIDCSATVVVKDISGAISKMAAKALIRKGELRNENIYSN